MDYAIGFILGAAAIGILWGLRELERRQWADDTAEQIETLRGENTRLRGLEQLYRQGFVYFKDGVHQLRNDLGGNGKLPAPAEPFRQHCSQRVTARLAGPSAGGPHF
jgi:hypothetical protein